MQLIKPLFRSHFDTSLTSQTDPFSYVFVGFFIHSFFCAYAHCSTHVWHKSRVTRHELTPFRIFSWVSSYIHCSAHTLSVPLHLTQVSRHKLTSSRVYLLFSSCNYCSAHKFIVPLTIDTSLASQTDNFSCIFIVFLTYSFCYGVATISRLLKIKGLFCKRAL